ncbi:hypothetical protein D3C75_1116600 [compost metagenome]
MDLHINAGGTAVLIEPPLGDQLRLFAGKVFGWLVTLGHSLFGKQDGAIPILPVLQGIDELVEPGANGLHLTRRGIGIAPLQLHPQRCLGVPLRLTDDIDQVVVAGTLIL